jgi:hypothetical protein
MNISFKLRCLVCCLIFAALSSVTYGQGDRVSGPAERPAQPVSAPVTTSDDTPVDATPVPEPSVGSLLLLSLGGMGLVMKLRKRP